MRRLAAWSGDAMTTDAEYLAAQQRTADYAKRDMPVDFRHFLRGEFDLPTRLDPRTIACHRLPLLQRYICAFLGSDEYLVHYPPMVRFVPPGANVSAVPIHQDTSYNDHMVDFCTLWVPLCDVDDACGGVIVFDGSQREQPLDHGPAGSWEMKAAIKEDRYPMRQLHMPAGGALLFAKTLLHKSASNVSTRTRHSLDFRVFRTSADSTKSFYDPFRDQVTRKH
jgi:hypothetical protein